MNTQLAFAINGLVLKTGESVEINGERFEWKPPSSKSIARGHWFWKLKKSDRTFFITLYSPVSKKEDVWHAGTNLPLYINTAEWSRSASGAGKKVISKVKEALRVYTE